MFWGVYLATVCRLGTGRPAIARSQSACVGAELRLDRLGLKRRAAVVARSCPLFLHDGDRGEQPGQRN
jgi:hypothetical protein